MRWKVEGLFSSIKRIFGESVRVSSRDRMFPEAQMKFRGTISIWGLFSEWGGSGLK